MWTPTSVLFVIFGLSSASIFSQDLTTGETDIKNHEASLSSDVDGRENANLFSNSDWSNGEPNTASLAEWNDQNADSFLASTDSNLPISDDWAYQVDAGVPTSGCNAPTSSRMRLKRFDERCPAEAEEDKPICETALFSITLCCLGPQLGGLIIVNRCQPYDFFIYYCRNQKYVYCCQEYEEIIPAGVVCIKAFPSAEDDEPIPFPPNLDGPFPDDFPNPGGPFGR